MAVLTMASSPTTVIRRSSLRMSTRTVWLTERSDSSCGIERARPPGPATAATAPATGGRRAGASLGRAARPLPGASRDVSTALARAGGAMARAPAGAGWSEAERSGGPLGAGATTHLVDARRPTR